MVLLLFGRGWRLAPNTIFDVDPAHAKHLAAPSAGQEQEPDGVGDLPSGVLAERLDQPHQLVAREVAAAVIFNVALDPLDRIRVAPAPAHSECEHLAENGYGAVGSVGATSSGDLAVQGVDVPE